MRRLLAILGICAVAGTFVLATPDQQTAGAPQMPALDAVRETSPVPPGTPMLSIDGIESGMGAQRDRDHVRAREHPLPGFIDGRDGHAGVRAADRRRASRQPG